MVCGGEDGDHEGTLLVVDCGGDCDDLFLESAHTKQDRATGDDSVPCSWDSSP